jgi:hypothetical protein
MKPGSSDALALLHRKTRRRYPLDGGDLVIGRSTGQVVFAQDPKLSGKHCLIRKTPEGYAIHDLKSRTGVTINGHHLPAGKACVLKPGQDIRVGDQDFRVIVAPARSRGAARSPWFIAAMATVLLATGALFMLTALRPAALAPSPTRRSHPGPLPSVSRIETELQDAVRRYKSFGESLRLHRLTEQQTLDYLQRELIPRFSSVHNELQAYRPPRPETAGHIDLQRRMAGVLLGQVTAMANYIKTKDMRYSLELNQYNRAMEVLNEEYAKARRDPSGEPAF